MERYEWNSSFSKSKRRKLLIPPLLINLVAWFSDMFYNFGFSFDRFKKKLFLWFQFLSTPSPKFGHNWILIRGYFGFKISNDTPIEANSPNLNDFGWYQSRRIIFLFRDKKMKTNIWHDQKVILVFQDHEPDSIDIPPSLS